MVNLNNMSVIILNNPLIISLFIYVIICVIIYFVKPKSMFGDVYIIDEDDNKNRIKRLFQKNIKIIFIIMPFIIYGLVCIVSSLIGRRSYCDLLKTKELNIKDLLKKCKK